MAPVRPSLHTHKVRTLLVTLALAICLAPTSASADDARKPHRPDNFWEWLIDPHGAEIRLIIDRARENRRRASNEYPAHDSHGLNENNRLISERLLTDALGMLRYAATLEPDNADIKREIAFVSYDLGRSDEAHAALTDYLQSEVSERVDASAHWRRGHLFARQREWKSAIVALRLALDGRRSPVILSERSQAIRCLANVYMETGRMAEAIEVLESSLPSEPSSDPLLHFSLALAYDRDEQLTRAHELLDKLVNHNRYGSSLIHLFTQHRFQGGAMLFTPPADRHYYHALLFEISDLLSEARTEWLAYARTADAPYARRARTHVDAIDKILRQRLGKARRPAARHKPARPARPRHP